MLSREYIDFSLELEETALTRHYPLNPFVPAEPGGSDRPLPGDLHHVSLG